MLDCDLSCDLCLCLMRLSFPHERVVCYPSGAPNLRDSGHLEPGTGKPVPRFYYDRLMVNTVSKGKSRTSPWARDFGRASGVRSLSEAARASQDAKSSFSHFCISDWQNPAAAFITHDSRAFSRPILRMEKWYFWVVVPLATSPLS